MVATIEIFEPLRADGSKKGTKNPIICLKETQEDKFAFQFGVSKAKLILDHVEQIRQFYDKFKKVEVVRQANTDTMRTVKEANRAGVPVIADVMSKEMKSVVADNTVFNSIRDMKL